MKLFVTRNQQADTGLFGGHKGMTFVLNCRIELTAEEKSLVAKYKAEEHPLTFREHEGRQYPSLTVSSLINGTSSGAKDITVLLRNEEVIKGACEEFRTLLRVMATFGGEEIVEYN